MSWNARDNGGISEDETLGSMIIIPRVNNIIHPLASCHPGDHKEEAMRENGGMKNEKALA